MKILVLSDSHGAVENLEHAVAETTPQVIFHLGDCWRDAEILRERHPDILFYQVPGNCDYRSEEPGEQLVTMENCRILLCHGHQYNVKFSLVTAGMAAEEKDLDVFLFGHTHCPLVDRRGKTLFLNPGACSGWRPSYGILTLENGKADAEIHLLSPQ